jgi:hypothetical protein
MSHTISHAVRDNRANQLNPYHPAYWQSRGIEMPPPRYIPSIVTAGKIKPSDNQSNQQNPNKGTDGTNKQYDQAQGNKGKQLDPNRQPPAPGQKKR